MKLKKLLAGFMTLAMLVTTLPATAMAAAGEECTGEGCTHVAAIGDTHYADLHDALSFAGAANAGSNTIEILVDEIDLSSVNWTPVKVDGYHGADVVTVEGNDCVITGLKAPLFSGGFAGGSGIIINDLTISDSEIVSSNDMGSGAFIESMDSMDVITLDNCHLLNSKVTGSRTGGLIGWTSGYNNVNDGPVKMYVTISDCSVIGCEITGSSVGAINGHAGANAWTYTTIEDCTIEDNQLISTDDGSWRVGVVVGTANLGEVTIEDITESDNTLTQDEGNVTAPEGQNNLFGRFVPSTTGKLTIDGVEYKADGTPYVYVAEIEGGDKYETLAEAFNAAQSGNTVTILANGTYTLSTSGKDLTIKAADGVKATFDNISAKNMGGADVTFENVAFDYYPNVNYTGLQHSGDLVYNDCTFEGQPFLYGESDTFNNCTFNQNSADAYNFWSYGSKDLTFTDCTFNSAGKSALIYNEGVNEKVTFDNCTFNASAPVEGKAAIEIDSTYADFEVTIKDCTMTGFDNGSVSGQPRWNIKKPAITNTTVDGTTTVYETGSHTVTINETTTPEEEPTPSKNKTKKYDVIIKSADNGDVEVDDDYAKRGQEITITVDPDKGYELDELTITDQYGDEVDYEEGKKENTFVFDMPKSDVTIEASFDKESSSVADKDDEDKDDEEVVDKDDEDASAGDDEQKYIKLTIGQKIAWVFDEYVVNDVAPEIRNERTMLPIRFVAEALGATVTWNEAEQKVTITEDDLVIEIFIGQPFATVNGEPVELDAPAYIANDRTYLPLRFVAENLGAEVVWNAADSTVTIYE